MAIMKAILTKTVEIEPHPIYGSYSKEFGTKKQVIIIRLFNVPIYRSVRLIVD